MRVAWLVPLILTGCRTQPVVTRPTLAMFQVQTEHLSLPTPTLKALDTHAHRLVATSEAFRVVPQPQVTQALKRARRAHPRVRSTPHSRAAPPLRARRGDRRCRTLACQARVGDTLHAGRSLSLQITRNLLGQCDVIGNLNDLANRRVAHAARARAGCSEPELARLVDLVLYRLVRLQHEDASPQRECLARAEFLWIDRTLEAMLEPGTTHRREGWQVRMADKVLELKREYDHVARHGVERWTVAALCRSGRLYEYVAGQQREVPPAPSSIRRQGLEAVQQYEEQQRRAGRQRAMPFDQQARRLYRQCLERAERSKLAEDSFTAQARARLTMLDRTGP